MKKYKLRLTKNGKQKTIAQMRNNIYNYEMGHKKEIGSDIGLYLNGLS